MKLTFKNVLITGGAGFIGSNIASKIPKCIRTRTITLQSIYRNFIYILYQNKKW